MTDESALRAELEQVRHDMLEDVGGDVLTARELVVGFGVGVPAFAFGLLFVGIALSPRPGEERSLTALALGVVLLVLSAFLLRHYVQRRVREIREYRRLRRRERELVAALPPGTTGPGSGRRYLPRFFGGGPIALLLVLALVVAGAVVVAAQG